MSFSAEQRERFRQVGGLMLPAWENMPDAAALGIESRQLDQALAARPRLALPVAAILDRLTPPVDAASITSLQQASPPDFLLLRLLVCGAYYLHPAVRDALGYPGQQAQSLPRGGFGGEELVLKMMEKPKRYRDVG